MGGAKRNPSKPDTAPHIKPMTEYRRNFVKGGSYFFTVALADRSQSLFVDYIDLLRAAFRYGTRPLLLQTPE